MSQRNIVIVGGGEAGVLVAAQLSTKLDKSKYKLVLISERGFFTHLPACLRVNVADDDKLEDKCFLPLAGFFTDSRPGEFIQGRAVRLDATSVHLEGGRTVEYHALVVATGNTWRGMLNFPHERTDTLTWIGEWREKFSKAKRVVIVGGGPVGVELAGEIKQFHKGTAVTIIHEQALLLNKAYPDKFRKGLADQVKKAGVELLLGEKVVDVPAVGGDLSSPVKTASGKTIEADLVLPMYGGTPNSDLLKSLDAAMITTSGHVRVLPTLQVPLSSGQRNVFVLGDIIDWEEQHMQFKTTFHAPVVIDNLLAVIEEKPATKEYKGSIEAILVTLGKFGGLGFLPKLWGITFPSWTVPNLKGKGLLIAETRKAIGL